MIRSTITSGLAALEKSWAIMVRFLRRAGSFKPCVVKRAVASCSGRPCSVVERCLKTSSMRVLEKSNSVSSFIIGLVKSRKAKRLGQILAKIVKMCATFFNRRIDMKRGIIIGTMALGMATLGYLKADDQHKMPPPYVGSAEFQQI